ncbi:MAG: hypothetical protein WD607_11505 [Candidatus Paceibacterota bacterium]
MAKNNSKKTFQVQFKTPATYRTYTADGAVAGDIMDDKVILEFFIHKQEMPDYLEFELDNEGKPKSDATPKGGFPGLTRERQFGLVMSLDKIVTLRNELNKILDRPSVKRRMNPKND